MITDVRACSVSDPSQHDDPSVTGRQPTMPKPCPLFNLGKYLHEEFSLAHDSAIEMVSAWLWFNQNTLGGFSSKHIQVKKGGLNPLNKIERGDGGEGKADLIYWTPDTVYVWDVKNHGGRAEREGVDDVADYVKDLQAQLKKKGDNRTVKAGFDLPYTLTAPALYKPGTLLSVQSSTRFKGKGVITYQQKTMPKPQPTTAPAPQPEGDPAWKTGAKWIAGGLALGAAVGISVGTVAEDVGTGGAGIADDAPSFGVAGGLARWGISMF